METSVCRVATVYWNETRGRTDQLIDADNVARTSGTFDTAQVTNAFATPGFAMSLSISTARASRGRDVAELPRNVTSTSHELQGVETHMPKAFMERDEEFLLAMKAVSKFW